MHGTVYKFRNNRNQTRRSGTVVCNVHSRPPVNAAGHESQWNVAVCGLTILLTDNKLEPRGMSCRKYWCNKLDFSIRNVVRNAGIISKS